MSLDLGTSIKAAGGLNDQIARSSASSWPRRLRRSAGPHGQLSNSWDAAGYRRIANPLPHIRHGQLYKHGLLLSQIELDPEEYGEHRNGRSPLQIRRPYLFRALKAVTGLCLVTAPFILALTLINSSPYLWLAFRIALIGAVVMSLLVTVLRPLPRKQSRREPSQVPDRLL